MEKEYKDLLGNRIYPNFRICGTRNDIPVVTLCHIKEFKLFGIVWYRYSVKLYEKVTTASLVEVSNWSEIQFDDWVNKAIDSYNENFGNRKALEFILKEKNKTI